MAQIKDEAHYEAQAAEAAQKLAQIRRPKLDAALATVDEMSAALPTLVMQRDALHDGGAKRALSNLISVLTSTPGLIRAEIADLPGETAE